LFQKNLPSSFPCNYLFFFWPLEDIFTKAPIKAIVKHLKERPYPQTCHMSLLGFLTLLSLCG
jgi:hypothetical protein